MDVQNEFGSLDLMEDSSYIENFTDDGALFGCEKGSSPDKAAEASTEYVPVNYICPEVYALIAAWESASKQVHSTGTSTPKAVLMKNSLQSPCSAAVPPKRFFRTFWKSLSRKLMRRSQSMLCSDGLVYTDGVRA